MKRLEIVGVAVLAVLVLVPSIARAQAGPTGVHPTREISTGLRLLDLDGRGKPFGRDQQGVGEAQVSASGNAVVWEYNNLQGSVGSVWHSLQTGRTIVQEQADQPSVSGDGRLLVYDTTSRALANGNATAQEIWLMNTRSGRRSSVDRRTPGARADDGFTQGLTISADGDAVVFSSSSPALAPMGVHECVPFVDHGCPEAAGYLYLYERRSRKVLAVPPQPYFERTPELASSAISADGGVVAFSDGFHLDLWFPAEAVVRRVPDADLASSSDRPGLAISGDGSTLAYATGFGVQVLRLGGPSGPITVEWSHNFDSATGAEVATDHDVALSQTGSMLAMFGPSGPAGWGDVPLYTVGLPTGTMSLLPIPGTAKGLPAEARHQPGQASDRVSLTADGTRLVATACINGALRPGGQSCPVRSDVFAWNVP